MPRTNPRAAYRHSRPFQRDRASYNKSAKETRTPAEQIAELDRWLAVNQRQIDAHRIAGNVATAESLEDHQVRVQERRDDIHESERGEIALSGEFALFAIVQGKPELARAHARDAATRYYALTGRG